MALLTLGEQLSLAQVHEFNRKLGADIEKVMGIGQALEEAFEAHLHQLYSFDGNLIDTLAEIQEALASEKIVSTNFQGNAKFNEILTKAPQFLREPHWQNREYAFFFETSYQERDVKKTIQARWGEGIAFELIEQRKPRTQRTIYEIPKANDYKIPGVNDQYNWDQPIIYSLNRLENGNDLRSIAIKFFDGGKKYCYYYSNHPNAKDTPSNPLPYNDVLGKQLGNAANLIKYALAKTPMPSPISQS